MSGIRYSWRMTTAAAIAMATALWLAGCAGKPPAPDWQMNAQAALERSVQAYLVGNTRLEAVDFARARSEIAGTGRADLLARAELVRCAARVASLVQEPCTGYDVLAADAAPAEQAYARYLQGQSRAEDLALLPPQHRAVAASAASGAALQGIEDPLARLVAAGVVLRQDRADPAVIATAIATASAQGWRRPLLAWLGVQARRAELAGDTQELARIQRRMALVTDTLPR